MCLQNVDRVMKTLGGKYLLDLVGSNQQYILFTYLFKELAGNLCCRRIHDIFIYISLQETQFKI